MSLGKNTLIELPWHDELRKIFSERLGFEIFTKNPKYYDIVSQYSNGFSGDQIKNIERIDSHLYISQIISNQGRYKNTESMLLKILDLNETDSHFGFFGYRNDKAIGKCFICGKQTTECNHEYTRASEFVRNCQVCDFHEYCKSCKKETCGIDICTGDICSKCYEIKHKEF